MWRELADTPATGLSDKQRPGGWLFSAIPLTQQSFNQSEFNNRVPPKIFINISPKSCSFADLNQSKSCWSTCQTEVQVSLEVRELPLVVAGGILEMFFCGFFFILFF